MHIYMYNVINKGLLPCMFFWWFFVWINLLQSQKKINIYFLPYPTLGAWGAPRHLHEMSTYFLCILVSYMRNIPLRDV